MKKYKKICLKKISGFYITPAINTLYLNIQVFLHEQLIWFGLVLFGLDRFCMV
jgi:hypothetical protein